MIRTVTEESTPWRCLSPRGVTKTALRGLDARATKRRRTSHLKAVPESRSVRDKIRVNARRSSRESTDRNCCRSRISRHALARFSENLDCPKVISAGRWWCWHQSFGATKWRPCPPSRRLFLLPHCLKHAEGCPADYDEFGLDCEKCGACSIADFRSVAENLGYKVLVAEGSPIVLKIIVSGYVDAIVGVACLNVLEKAIDKILLAGVPCMAVPLLSSDCRNTSVDEDWVEEMIHVKHETPSVQTPTYLHLMRLCRRNVRAGRTRTPRPPAPRRTATGRTERRHGSQASIRSPPPRRLPTTSSPRAAKHSRPFVTLATYDALAGGRSTGADGVSEAGQIPDAVRRTALSIETFHKASLVHDDIEDDDAFRYGDPTLHRTHGVPTAINVGDYLIGMGYRLVSRDARHLAPMPRPTFSTDLPTPICDCPKAKGPSWPGATPGTSGSRRSTH